LWSAAWCEPGPADFGAILSRSLGHVGAYAGERLVGFVNLAWDGGVHAFILDTCVHPDMRCNGVGTGLVMRAIEIARHRRIEWVHVDYEPRFARFYEGCGFRPTAAGLLRLQG
jgi:GNAT superfamily N-acetyltransferase